ncbi:hypothetical protein JRI60_38465 [Archangium violaceum]|uniref:hypothetical protein n=1 Tax=Archangium violaceum TaxID=83451 RepID=UPI00195224FF|nr:hypothetical protein [Archangium violaceum]QRN94946.1 hypothetical protein JRI60_38465 [Archangium violaceum]
MNTASATSSARRGGSFPWALLLALGLLPWDAYASDPTPLIGRLLLPPAYLLIIVGLVVTSQANSQRLGWGWLVLLGLPGIPLFVLCAVTGLQLGSLADHPGVTLGSMVGAAGLVWVGIRLVRAVSD